MTKKERTELETTLELLRDAWRRNPSGRPFYEKVARRLIALTK